MRDLQDRKTALTLNTLIGTISSAIAIVGGVATGNPVAVGGGVLSLGKTASNAVTGAMSLHPNANVSLLNTNSSWMASLYFTLRTTTKQAHKIGVTILGLPCNEWRQIKDESYYLECVNVEFDDYTTLCKDEIDMIRNQLARGIYCQ